jgi:hypothetical protein
MGRWCTHSLALLGLATIRSSGVGKSLSRNERRLWVGILESFNHKHSRRCEIRRTEYHDHHDYHDSSYPSQPYTTTTGTGLDKHRATVALSLSLGSSRVVHDRRETVPTREGGQYRLRYRVLAYGAVNRLGGVERTYWSPERKS